MEYIHGKKTWYPHQETMNQAEGLWVMDQLWKHVGMMIHHLPQKDKNRIMSTCIFLNVRLLYPLFFCPVAEVWPDTDFTDHHSKIIWITRTGRSGSLPGNRPGRKWPHLFRGSFHSRHGSPGRPSLCWTGYRWKTHMHPPLFPTPPPSTGQSCAGGPNKPWLLPILRKYWSEIGRFLKMSSTRSNSRTCSNRVRRLLSTEYFRTYSIMFFLKNKKKTNCK